MVYTPPNNIMVELCEHATVQNAVVLKFFGQLMLVMIYHNRKKLYTIKAPMSYNKS